VRRGVAKEQPDKVTLEEDDLRNLINETSNKIKDLGGAAESEVPNADGEEDSDEGDGNMDDDDDIDGDNNGESVVENKDDDVVANTTTTNEDDDEDAIRAEYGLDDYDEDTEGSLMTGAGMAGLMYFDSNKDDPYINVKDLEEEERGESLIKSSDNLFVAGKMEEEYSCLDVYVYNEEEGNCYVHHDILIDSFPLCLEWLSFDPCSEEKSGNYIALGTMEPEIQIWDLDVIDTIEPVFVLGEKKKKKKKKKKPALEEATEKLIGHSDSVLSLSWNRNVKKILASGSADKTVLLWDMSQGTPVHCLKHHTDKVQSISWHPVEAQSLLTASFDKTAIVVDCQSPGVFKSWSLTGECEQVLWDTHSPFNFFVSTDDGVVAYYDVRTNDPVFKINAHEKEVTGIAVSKHIPGCLTTVSADESIKVWNYTSNKPSCVMSRDLKMGGLNFVSACPDVGLTFGIGGEKEGLRMLNLLETTQGKEHFNMMGARKGVVPENTTPDATVHDDVQMDAENTVKAMSTLSLKKDSETVIVKRKKKKKKKK